MRQNLLSKLRGFTLVEVLLAGSLVSLLMGGAFYLLSVSESSRSLSMAKAEVQAENRRAMDSIVNDVRQTLSSKISLADSYPGRSHIKFQRVNGFNPASTGVPTLGNFIEYTYDSNAKTITRTDLGSNRSWTFRNIIQPPFKTRLPDKSVIFIDPLTSGADSPIKNTGNMVVVIVGQLVVSPTLTVTNTLEEEVKIRNE